jgi:hypothetical protein
MDCSLLSFRIGLGYAQTEPWHLCRGHHPHGKFVKLAQIIPCQVPNRFESWTSTIFEKQYVISELKGVVGLVRTEQNAQAPAVNKLTESSQHPALVSCIESRGGLVQNKKAPALAQCPGNQDELPLTATEFLNTTVRMLPQPDCLECRLSRTPVSIPRTRAQSSTRHASQHHCVQNGEVERHLSGLGNVADGLGESSWPVTLKAAPEDLDFS